MLENCINLLPNKNLTDIAHFPKNYPFRKFSASPIFLRTETHHSEKSITLNKRSLRRIYHFGESITLTNKSLTNPYYFDKQVFRLTHHFDKNKNFEKTAGLRTITSTATSISLGQKIVFVYQKYEFRRNDGCIEVTGFSK